MKLVCTDLDRTLLPNGEQPESPHARPILWHLLSTHSAALAYVSGRDLRRVLDAISEYDLQVPDAIVADVGTSLYTRNGDSWTPSAEWESRVLKDWNGQDTFGVKAILKHIEGLQNQEEDRQSLYKRSYYYSESADESRLVRAVESCLAENDITASVVISHDPEKAVGLMDVLPKSATKREAVSYLQSSFHLAKEDVMFAGDSGNDVSALCAEQPGVLVANADAPTREAVQKAVEKTPTSNTYFAQGELEVAGCATLNGNYSAGIIEGLVHFRPQWGEYLHNTDWLVEALSGGPLPDGVSSRQSA